MQGISRQNGGMRNILIVIVVFFKFAWAISAYSKYAKAITAAFDQVLSKAYPRHPRRLQTDNGKESYNWDLQALMNRHNIQHFASKSKQKEVAIKRLNRTNKTKI